MSAPPHQRLTRRFGNLIEDTCPNRDWEVFDGLNVRLRPGHIRIDGTYGEYATAADGVLRLERPWPLSADLRALARGRGG